jgi:hypothetical protein
MGMRSALIFLLLVACGGNSKGPAAQPPAAPKEPEKIPFVLILNNRSFDLDPVDVRVQIDGEQVAEQDLPLRATQVYFTYELQLTPGTHLVRALTSKGQVTFEETFDIGWKRWALLTFHYNAETHQDPKPAHFTWEVMDEAPNL